MSTVSDKVAAFNRMIDDFNARRRAAVKAFDDEKASILKQVGLLEVQIVLRLHQFEDEERWWVSRHPLAAFVLALIAMVAAFGLGIVVARMFHGAAR